MGDPLSFDDLRWTTMLGGYRIPCDPRPVLIALERGDAAAWEDLWTDLHHQGDVGEASYAAVPHRVRIYRSAARPDWRTYSMVALIEDVRREPDNPPIPDFLKPAYDAAWKSLVEIGIEEVRDATDPLIVSSIIGVLAFAKGLKTLGRLAKSYTEDELQELIGIQDGQ